MKRIPKGKHIFGIVKIGEKGQILIPKEAREVFGLKPGDKLLMLGDEKRGIALVTVDEATMFADMMPYLPVIGENADPNAADSDIDGEGSDA